MTGVEDYSGFEVIRAAMEVEKNGHRFYRSMVDKARSEVTREVFSWLAQDEVQHLHTLEGILPLFEQGAFWEDEEQFLPYLRRFADERIFPDPERLEALIGDNDPDLQALDLAIEAEEKFAAILKERKEKLLAL